MQISQWPDGTNPLAEPLLIITNKVQAAWKLLINNFIPIS